MQKSTITVFRILSKHLASPENQSKFVLANVIQKVSFQKVPIVICCTFKIDPNQVSYNFHVNRPGDMSSYKAYLNEDRLQPDVNIEKNTLIERSWLILSLF